MTSKDINTGPLLVRLRYFADRGDYYSDWGKEAADEIERLGNELAAKDAEWRIQAELKEAAIHEIERLEQCHREGWLYAREVEDEYRRRTGHGFAPSPKPMMSADGGEDIPLAPSADPHCEHGVDIQEAMCLACGIGELAHQSPLTVGEKS